MWHFFKLNTTLSKSASDKFVDTKKLVWCKQSLICQSSVEAMGMAVWAVKLKTHKKTVCPKKILFEGKQQWSLKCIPGCVHPPHPFPSPPSRPLPPHADPSSRADERNPKGRHRGTSAIWSKLLPKGPTEEQSINPVAVLSWEKKKNSFTQIKTWWPQIMSSSLA